MECMDLECYTNFCNVVMACKNCSLNVGKLNCFGICIEYMRLSLGFCRSSCRLERREEGMFHLILLIYKIDSKGRSARL